MTWLLDLVRRSVREYKPLEGHDPQILHTGTSFLDLRHTSRKWHLTERSAVAQVISSTCADELQDSAYSGGQYLKREIAMWNGVSVSEIVFGLNPIDLLRNLLFCLIEENDEAVISTPSPSCYQDMIQLYGGRYVNVQCGKDLTPDQDLLLAACNQKSKIMIVTNPLYLSGVLVGKEEFSRLLSSIQKNRILLILNEWGINLGIAEKELPGHELYKDYGRVITIRSLPASYGIPANDLAYALLPASLANEYNKVAGLSAPLDIPIQHAIFHLKNFQEVEKIRNRMSCEKEKMKHRLIGMGLEPIDNITSNIAFHTVEADRIWEGLAKEGIVITNGNNNSLPGYLIFSLGLPDDNERLLSSLRKVLSSLGHQ